MTARKIEAEEFVGNFTSMFQSIFIIPSFSFHGKVAKIAQGLQNLLCFAL